LISFGENFGKWIKKCFYCFSKIISKHGNFKGKQKYKCYSCGKQFYQRLTIDVSELYEEYQKGKQTYEQLSEKYNCITKTIMRRLDEYSPIGSKIKPRAVIIIWSVGRLGKRLLCCIYQRFMQNKNTS